MLHLMAFLATGILVGLIVVIGWHPGRGSAVAGLVGGVVGALIGGWLLYHGGAGGHHRFLSLVSAALVAAVLAAGGQVFVGPGGRTP